MKIKATKINYSLLFVYLLLINALLFNPVLAEPNETEAVLCTADAMLCSDGSYVGRTGPKCEFICPSSTSTVTEIGASTTPSSGEENISTSSESQPESKTAEQTNPQPTNPTTNQQNQSALSKDDQKRIINLAANVSNRLDAVVARLFNITTRIESRIVLQKQQGFATSDAEGKLRQAIAPLAKAKNLLTDIDSSVFTAVTSEQPQHSWQAVKTRYQEITGLVKDSYAGLEETIQILQTATKESSSLATSTDITTKKTSQPE